jgi:hypothetical protein
MQSEIKVGQHFKFNISSDNPSQERQAVVTRVLSNREEGLGPEVDFYLAYWVEAYELPETELLQRWCLSVELTETYTSTDVWLPSLC